MAVLLEKLRGGKGIGEPCKNKIITCLATMSSYIFRTLRLSIAARGLHGWGDSLKMINGPAMLNMTVKLPECIKLSYTASDNWSISINCIYLRPAIWSLSYGSFTSSFAQESLIKD